MSLQRNFMNGPVVFLLARAFTIILAAAVVTGERADALSTAFTYQGELAQSGTPTNDTCDLQFRLYDAASAGALLGTQTVTAVVITDGLFTVLLNDNGQFGGNPFNGNDRWLEIAVRCPAGIGSYTSLSPRQPLTAAPYALYATAAGIASGLLCNGCVTSANLTNDALQLGTISVTGTSSLAVVGGGSVLTADGTFGSAVGWTVGSHWSIANAKATHTPPDGLPSTLSGTTAALAGTLYQVNLLMLDRTAGSIGVRLGTADAGVSLSANGATTVYVATPPVIVGNAALLLTPTSDFDGSITQVTLYRVTPALPDAVINSSTGTINPLEIRAGGSGQASLYLGAFSGQSALSQAIHNTGLGQAALQNNTEGIQNTALGYWALRVNTTGDGNTAVGNGALDGNLTGSWNNAVGHHSNYRNVTGSGNNAFGSQALTNANGEGNSAFGNMAMAGSYHADGPNQVNHSSAFGMNAGLFAVGSGNVFVGANAGLGTNLANAPETDDQAVLIGYNANRSQPTATKLTNYVGIGSGVLVDRSNQVKIGNAAMVEFDVYGHVQTTGAAPTLSACGTGPSAVIGNDNNGSFTMGADSPTSCTLTFNAPWTTVPNCMVNDLAGNGAHISAISSTGFTVTISSGASDVISYVCLGRF